ncbi:hypothetical protein [Arcobacter sp.]|uniref:hypothetical protein n=1 Tax=Arcobacter sp. TaxID=1872629 RepID=UPI003D0C8FC9
MNINLVKFIVPCIDSIIAKNFYKRIFGFGSIKEEDKTIIVKINNTLKFKLEECEDYINNHYIFEVDEEYFKFIISNIKKEKLYFGDDINNLENKKIKKTSSKNEIYFIDPNSHLFQIYSKISFNPQ